MFVRVAFLVGVGDVPILALVPILGPGGVFLPEGEVGRIDKLDKLEFELDGVESIELLPSGLVGRDEFGATDELAEVGRGDGGALYTLLLTDVSSSSLLTARAIGGVRSPLLAARRGFKGGFMAKPALRNVFLTEDDLFTPWSGASGADPSQLRGMWGLGRECCGDETCLSLSITQGRGDVSLSLLDTEMDTS